MPVAAKNGANSPGPRTGGSPPRSKRRWLYAVLVLALLFVLMPFLFWQATWFGRPLDDAQITKFLEDHEHPRNAQHALAQIEQRIENPDPSIRASARQWYPEIIRVAALGGDEFGLRPPGSWGRTIPRRRSIRRCSRCSVTGIRWFAAMLRWAVRFSDAAGHDEIVGMLSPYTVIAPAGGAIATRLKPDETVNAGTSWAVS